MQKTAAIHPSRRYIIKTLKVMKLTCLLLTAAVLQVSAKAVSQTVSLSANNITLEKVFSEVRRQTGYAVMYADDALNDTRPVTVSADNLPLVSFIQLVLRDQPIRFIIENKTILLSRTTPVAPTSDIAAAGRQLLSALSGPVTGKVLDTDGQPLAGASILIKKGNVMAVTNAEGMFNLNVSAGDIVVISFVGYRTKEIVITPAMVATVGAGASPGLVVMLARSESTIDSVTVVSNGYQTLSKERSAGSFAKADMDIVVNRSISMNILQSLDGLLPGLTVNNAPGRVPFLVRGLTTIGAPSSTTIGLYSGMNPNPLYVVDGIAMSDVSSINPQDVRDITLLKDATAASIWGARAANGVIVINTKRGSLNSRTRITYDGFINFQGKPDLDYRPMLTSSQYIQAAKDIFNAPNYTTIYPWQTVSAYVNTGSRGVPPHEMILYNQSRGLITAAQANKSLDSLAGIDNHAQIANLLYRNAALMNHTLSMSGGGNTHSFYGSFSYTDLQSDHPGEANNTYKFNLRQDFKLNNALQVYLITDLTQTSTSAKRNMSNGLQDIDYTFYPYQLFKDGSGNNLSMSYLKYLSDSTKTAFENRSRISLDYNPLNEFDYGYTKNDVLFARINGGVTLKLYKGLRFEGTYGYVRGSSKLTSYDDLKSYLVRSEIVQFTVSPTATSTPVYYLPTNGGKYSVNAQNERDWTVRNQLVYDNTWGRHQLIVLAGQEAQERFSTVNVNTVRGFNETLQTSGAVDFVTLGAGLASPVMPNLGAKSQLINDNFGTTETDSRFTSYYSNLAYTYNRRYVINGSWRLDQSTLFGKDKAAQNKPIWSTGVKWIASNENFMKNVSWLDRLDLRVSYGLTGNSPDPGTASSYNIIKPVGSVFFPGGIGSQIATVGNPKLSWESTKTINLGLDFSILRGRFGGSVDLYQKKTSDMLGLINTNSLAGYPSVIGNLGNMTNKGIELGLNSANIRTRDFTWTTSLVLSYDKNKVDLLTSPFPITTGAQLITTQFLQDYPAFAAFAYNFAGLDNMGDPQVRLSDKTVTKTPNVTKPADILFMGTYQPIWNGGFSNSFRYKNFGLTANIVYSLGDVMRLDRRLAYTGQLRANVSADFLNRWKVPGDEAHTDIPSFETSPTVDATRRSDGYFISGNNNVVSASYIKLRDITLSYQLPQALTRKIKTEGVTFRVQLSNLMLWKGNKNGIDPEFQGILVPINQRTITAGLHVSI